MKHGLGLSTWIPCSPRHHENTGKHKSERLVLPFPSRPAPMQKVAKTLHRWHLVPAHQQFNSAMTKAGLGQAEDQEVLHDLSESSILVSGVHSSPLSFFLWITLASYSRPSSWILSSWVFPCPTCSPRQSAPSCGCPRHSVSITLGVLISLSLSGVLSFPLNCEDGIQVFFTLSLWSGLLLALCLVGSLLSSHSLNVTPSKRHLLTSLAKTHWNWLFSFSIYIALIIAEIKSYIYFSFRWNSHNIKLTILKCAIHWDLLFYNVVQQ